MALATSVVHVASLKGPKGDKGEGVADSLRFRPTSELPSLVVDEWLGTSLVGLYRFVTASAAQDVVGRPLGADGAAFAQVEPMASGGSKITWTEYAAPRRTFEKIISTTAGNRTDWKRVDTAFRTVLHGLSMPGAPTQTDTEPTRHVRLPFKVFSTIDSWELVFKNFNDRSSTNFGALDFVDVYISKRASDGAGGYTQNFAETPTKLGTPVLYSAGSTAERYVITDIHFPLEANVEYLISYAYSTPGGTPNHLGIGGSYLGTNPLGVASMSVSNAWSMFTPLDVYVKLQAPPEVPFYVYPGSSSETGLNTDYPLRDNWAWRHAEAHSAIPALIGQSGTTLESWVGANNYIRGKFSTIARADKVIGNPGSNDLYSGANLSTMKSRFEAFGVWVRRHLGDTFESADVFPRRTESSEVKTVREQFNAWLKTLPSNTLVSHDRVSVVVDDAGVMREDFDSGDGIHLNTYGQHMLGASILVSSGGGAPGPAGPAGPGVPAGGTAGQVLRKDSTGLSTVWETLNGSVVGLGNVDNTSDADKPVSTSTQEALDSKVSTVDVLVQAGDSAFTNGSIVKVGAYSFIMRPDVNMSVVLGGGVNNENVIGGNYENVNTGTSNLAGVLPTLTGTDGQWNFIMNGYDNVANGWAIILNGFHNRVAQGGNHATISGGSIHTIGNCNYATIAGGTGHNIADGASGAAIGGGIGHKASSSSTTIAGGNTNEASGMSSTVGGGRMHKASGSNSTISGGDTNAASGSGSAIPGGISNTAAGLGSIATGRGANAFAGGMRAHGSMVATPGDSQDMVVNMKRDTTTATASGLSLDGSGGLVIPVDTTWAIEATVVARRTDVDGESAAWRFTALMKRDAGNTAALIGTPAITSLGANAGNTWNLAVSYATAGNLNVTVTGEDGKTIRWLANLRIVSVSG